MVGLSTPRGRLPPASHHHWSSFSGSGLVHCQRPRRRHVAHHDPDIDGVVQQLVDEPLPGHGVLSPREQETPARPRVSGPVSTAPPGRRGRSGRPSQRLSANPLLSFLDEERARSLDGPTRFLDAPGAGGVNRSLRPARVRHRPSGMPIITGIAPSPDKPGHVVILVDGGPLATVPEQAAAGLALGQTAPGPRRAAARGRQGRADDLRAGAAVLSFQARSAKGAGEAPDREGEPREHVTTAIERLTASGLLDDARFAEAKARPASGKPRLAPQDRAGSRPQRRLARRGGRPYGR